MKRTNFRRHRLLTSLIAAALLVACGGGIEQEGEDDHDHDEVTIDTAGRLAIADLDSTTLRVHDLDTGIVDASHVMTDLPSAVYASPGGRYAVLPQRTQDRVQFVDGGIWQEDHGDHLHDYKEGSRLMPHVLNGPRPTHFDVQAGMQAALFMDGNAAAAPVQNARVHLITDTSITAGGTVATIDLAEPLHGLSEPVGNKLLMASRAVDAADTLPTHLVLHLRNGAGYNFVRELPTRCNGMHGSFSAGGSTVAGCVGGMLLVRHLSATTVNDGQLVATPLRVTTVAGHPRLPDHFIGMATEGAAPALVTSRFYTLDGETATVSDFVPEGWVDGRVQRAHGFDRSGQRLFVLDDQGTLIVSQRLAGGWAPLARVPAAVPAMPAAAPWPALAANGAKDELYLTDPVARQLVVINSATGAVTARRDLGYTPSALAWLGITR